MDAFRSPFLGFQIVNFFLFHLRACPGAFFSRKWKVARYRVWLQLSSLQRSEISTSVAVCPLSFVIRVLEVEAADSGLLGRVPVGPRYSLDPKFSPVGVLRKLVSRDTEWKLVIAITSPAA